MCAQLAGINIFSLASIILIRFKLSNQNRHPKKEKEKQAEYKKM